MRRVFLLGGLLLLCGVGAAHADTMPQLQFSNPLLLAQVVWLAIIFFALYLLLSKWALPQMTSVLQLRADTIAADLDRARAAKAQADSAVEELTEATRQAQARAQSEVNDAVAAARAKQAEESSRLGAELDRQLEEAERRIAEARQSAMGALRDVAGQAASALVGRLTGREPDPGAVDRAVSDALAARA